MTIEETVRLSRKNVIEGLFCDLIPLTRDDLKWVVSLRNKDRNKYYLNQMKEISLSEQEKWFGDYMLRKDDIYWGIWTKDHSVMIGTLRLYNIQEDVCEEGSCIIDEDYAKVAPYATEAKYLVGVFAFDVLMVDDLINEIRYDNKVMISLAKRQGYKYIRDVDIRGVTFTYWRLKRDNFKRESLKQVLDYWKDKC